MDRPFLEELSSCFNDLRAILRSKTIYFAGNYNLFGITLTNPLILWYFLLLLFVGNSILFLLVLYVTYVGSLFGTVLVLAFFLVTNLPCLYLAWLIFADFIAYRFQSVYPKVASVSRLLTCIGAALQIIVMILFILIPSAGFFVTLQSYTEDSTKVLRPVVFLMFTYYGNLGICMSVLNLYVFTKYTVSQGRWSVMVANYVVFFPHLNRKNTDTNTNYMLAHYFGLKFIADYAFFRGEPLRVHALSGLLFRNNYSVLKYLECNVLHIYYVVSAGIAIIIFLPIVPAALFSGDRLFQAIAGIIICCLLSYGPVILGFFANIGLDMFSYFIGDFKFWLLDGDTLVGDAETLEFPPSWTNATPDRQLSHSSVNEEEEEEEEGEIDIDIGAELNIPDAIHVKEEGSNSDSDENENQQATVEHFSQPRNQVVSARQRTQVDLDAAINVALNRAGYKNEEENDMSYLRFFLIHRATLAVVGFCRVHVRLLRLLAFCLAVIAAIFSLFVILFAFLLLSSILIYVYLNYTNTRIVTEIGDLSPDDVRSGSTLVLLLLLCYLLYVLMAASFINLWNFIRIISRFGTSSYLVWRDATYLNNIAVIPNPAADTFFVDAVNRFTKFQVEGMPELNPMAVKRESC
jgi:hypothetical protein